MSEVRAYALRESVEDFSGGSVAVGSEGHALNLAAELEQGDGIIATADPTYIAALDTVEVLRHVPATEVPEGQARVGEEPAGTNPSAHTKDELRSLLADEVGEENVPKGATKEELAGAIDRAKAGEAAEPEVQEGTGPTDENEGGEA